MTKNQNLWGGRFAQDADPAFAKFNNSFAFDRRLFAVDICASVAYCHALAGAGVISSEEGDKIAAGLQSILERGLANDSYFDEMAAEDVHSFVESRLVEIVGDAGRKLHTGRSRNDQVATDMRLWVRAAIDQLVSGVRLLQEAFLHLAEQNIEGVLPGYTHLQKAQPVLLAHHLLAWFEMFRRDCERFTALAEGIDATTPATMAIGWAS